MEVKGKKKNLLNETFTLFLLSYFKDNISYSFNIKQDVLFKRFLKVLFWL